MDELSFSYVSLAWLDLLDGESNLWSIQTYLICCPNCVINLLPMLMTKNLFTIVLVKLPLLSYLVFISPNVANLTSSSLLHDSQMEIRMWCCHFFCIHIRTWQLLLYVCNSQDCAFERGIPVGYFFFTLEILILFIVEPVWIRANLWAAMFHTGHWDVSKLSFSSVSWAIPCSA
jgi:hypothetical protein